MALCVCVYVASVAASTCRSPEQVIGLELKADDLEAQAPGTTYVIGHRAAKPPESDGPAEPRAVCLSADQE